MLQHIEHIQLKRKTQRERFQKMKNAILAIRILSFGVISTLRLPIAPAIQLRYDAERTEIKVFWSKEKGETPVALK